MVAPPPTVLTDTQKGYIMKKNKSKKSLIDRLSDTISEYQRYFAAWEDTAVKCDAHVAMRTANAINEYVEQFDALYHQLTNQANQLGKSAQMAGTTNDFRKLPVNPASRKALKAAKQARSMSKDAERLLGVFVAQAN